MDDESTTIIEQNFQAMLHEVASASVKALPVDYEQNEAEARHSWDRLFYLFYTGKNEMSSPYVLYAQLNRRPWLTHWLTQRFGLQA